MKTWFNTFSTADPLGELTIEIPETVINPSATVIAIDIALD